MAELAEESLGQRIRRLRRRKGLSVDKFSKLADVSKNQVTQIETGVTRQLRSDTLSRYAEVLGVSVEYILTGLTPSRASSARTAEEEVNQFIALATRLDPPARRFLLRVGDALAELRDSYAEHGVPSTWEEQGVVSFSADVGGDENESGPSPDSPERDIQSI